jgi:hypothetical protein
MGADDYLIQAILGAGEGFARAYVPFKEMETRDMLSRRAENEKYQREQFVSGSDFTDELRSELNMTPEQRISKEELKMRQPQMVWNPDKKTYEQVSPFKSKFTAPPKSEEDMLSDYEKKKTIDADIAERKLREKSSLKDKELFPIIKQKTEKIISDFRNMKRVALEIANDPYLKDAVGYPESYNPADIPSTEGRRVFAKIKNLKAQIRLNSLIDLKSMSATGASGMGPLSNEEGQALEQKIAALDTGQPVEGFKTALNDVVNFADDSEYSHTNTFNTHYGKYGKLQFRRDAGVPGIGGESKNSGEKKQRRKATLEDFN